MSVVRQRRDVADSLVVVSDDDVVVNTIRSARPHLDGCGWTLIVVAMSSVVHCTHHSHTATASTVLNRRRRRRTRAPAQRPTLLRARLGGREAPRARYGTASIVVHADARPVASRRGPGPTGIRSAARCVPPTKLRGALSGPLLTTERNEPSND